jgi:predicted Zn-dependent protease
MKRLAALLAVAALLAFSAAQPARALTLIRDAEIEHALGELARPLLVAAGLNPREVRVLLIEDSRPNAFVMDGAHIFIHTGLMLRTERAAQLQAVIAHEAAHIANGHIARRAANLRSARTAAAFGMLLATAAAAAGSAEAAGGIAMGSAGSAFRGFLAHTRAEEAAADQSGFRYMLRAGVDPRGAVEVLEFFRGQEALSAERQDPYARSHPLSRDRLRALEGLIAANPVALADPQAADYWFARAHGKLSAFTRAPAWTLRRASADGSSIGLMRQAVAYHRQPDAARARAAMERLLAARPNDPFVHELHGQILLESRDVAGAVRAYGRAAELAPGEPLILAGLGRALVALDTPEATRRAVDVLERARARDAREPGVLRTLAVAYARQGQPGLASLATAERYALSGRLGDARVHAERASGLLPEGSAPWQRARDVVRAHDLLERSARR